MLGGVAGCRSCQFTVLYITTQSLNKEQYWHFACIIFLFFDKFHYIYTISTTDTTKKKGFKLNQGTDISACSGVKNASRKHISEIMLQEKENGVD